jgi:murein DD-endopeptidase MepM/ murein hydrolase activator NlpD
LSLQSLYKKHLEFFAVQEGRLSGKKYTVLIIPEGSHKVRRFSVKRSLLRTVLTGILILTLGVSLVLINYFRLNVDQKELCRLKSRNGVQQEELRRLSASLEDLRQQLIIVAQNDAKVRVLAKLSKPKADSTAGVGGPSEEDPAANFSDLQHRIDQIRAAIDLRRDSQEEIQGFLNDQRSFLASKPEGVPVKGWVTSGFGPRKDPFTGKRGFHPGLDIAAHTGIPVHATADGIVSRAGPTNGGYGNLVVIDHGYGFKTYYGHNSKIYVKVGQRVKRGERIAAVGNTGRSTGSHCHYEVRLNNVPVNPKKYL